MSEWTRVNRESPCPICDKPDWCTVGIKMICCMRIESRYPCRNGGWLHSLGGTPPVRIHKPKPEPVAKDFSDVWNQFKQKQFPASIKFLAETLGVDVESLERIGCCDAGDKWAFPMKDWDSKIIGIRFRTNDGQKWALKGSRNGMFIPEDPPADQVLICEGPTDTAAALTLGFYAIGRPSCNCSVEMVQRFLKTHGIRKVCIVADNDEPGIRGAELLAKSLKMNTCMVIPPAKDIREFLKKGGTNVLMNCLIKNSQSK